MTPLQVTEGWYKKEHLTATIHRLGQEGDHVLLGPTWRCSLVGESIPNVLRDRGVTDGHHGHEV